MAAIRAIDSHILVRLLARDDPGQLASAEAFVPVGAWVSLLVLMETVWLLDPVYRIKPGPLANGVYGGQSRLTSIASN